MNDWDLFVELAKRLGANTSRSALDADVAGSVNLNGVFVTWDADEQRAHTRICTGSTSSRPSWLDNNILTWIDTLIGRDP